MISGSQLPKLSICSALMSARTTSLQDITVFALAIEWLRSPSMSRYEVWDTSEPGLGMRVGLRDKSFVLKLRFEGRQQWLTVGRFP